MTMISKQIGHCSSYQRAFIIFQLSIGTNVSIKIEKRKPVKMKTGDTFLFLSSSKYDKTRNPVSAVGAAGAGIILLPIQRYLNCTSTLL